MSGTVSNGGPAFPTDGRIQHGTEYDGMSLRDYFAGQALVGMQFGFSPQGYPAKRMAEGAYEIADAMLVARDGGQS